MDKVKLKQYQGELQEKESALEGLLQQPGWIKYMIPRIEELMKRLENVKSVDESKNDSIIADEIRSRKAKIHVYENILRLPQVMIDEIKTKKGEM